MTPDYVRAVALSLPHTEEQPHWEKTSFRINNKIFAVIQPDGRTLTVKISAEEREILTSSAPQSYTTPESFNNLNYMNIHLEIANREEVRELIHKAWSITAPKKLVKQYM